MPQISAREFERQPLRVHGFLAGVPLHDVWAAQKQLWNVARVVAEPGGAAALAALTSGRYKAKNDERVGVLVCGSNTEAVSFSSGQERGSEDASAEASALAQL